MEIEISGAGIGFGLFCVGVGIASMGYYIGKGLQNFSQTDKEIDYYTFLKESDLEMFLNLSKDEIQSLLNEHPDIPKITLKGTTYYPKKQLIEWITSKDIINKDTNGGNKE